MPTSPVRVAVVGVGYWGPNIVRNLHELSCAEVPIVCDFDRSALAKIARRYPGISCTAEFARVLNDECVDAVAIATPVATHANLVKAALGAGKHVFVEKPLAASVAEGEELRDLAAKSGLVLMPGHTFLYSPPVNVIRDLIVGGDLGEIYFITTSRVNLGLHQPDVSVIWDLGPHDFSILRYWLEETPIGASGLTRSCVVPGIPDVAFVNLQYASGVAAHAEFSWLAPSKLRRTAVIGSRKMAVYDDTSAEPVRVFDSGVILKDPETFGEYRLTYRTGDIVSPRIDSTEPLALEIADFCQAVQTGSNPRSSIDVGLDVLRMIETVENSLARSDGPLVLGPVPFARC